MISIVTPAYNNPEQLKKMLESIRRDAANDRELEVIVVDDFSSDDSIKRIAEGCGFARYIRNRANLGPASARNLGARSAKGETLLFLDSDIILKSDTLSRIRQRLSKDRTVQALCGEYDIEPANGGSFAARFKALMARSWIPKGEYISVFVARVGAMRKELFEKMGGFDESIKTASSEEWEFGRRLTDSGIKIHYDAGIAVRHHFPSLAKEMKLFFHRSFMWTNVFKKHGRFDNTCTTPFMALAELCGSASILFLILSPADSRFLSAALASFIIFVAGNIEFFKLTFRHEGALFTLKAVPAALILSLAVAAGAACGTAYHFLYEGLFRKGKIG